MAIRILLILALLSCYYCQEAQPPVIACYTEYNHPKTSLIPSGLCTHYQLIGESTVDWLGNFVAPSPTVIKSFTELRSREKENKPALLLTMTGQNPHWSRLVSFDGNMRKFAKAAAEFLTSSGLQGLDIDWEFPVWSEDAAYWDYDGFGRLLEILHGEMHGRGLLLTAAVSGPSSITRKAYNMTALNRFADLVFIMNYDFHVYKPLAPFVGFNAPLRSVKGEKFGLQEMNSEAAMNTYLKMKLAREKAIFGLPVYNLAYDLVNGYFHKNYALADGERYEYTSHDKVCNLSSADGWHRVWNERAASSYVYNSRRKIWITEESVDSVRAKVSYARSQKFGGIMIFSVGTDDVHGICNGFPFPLIQTARRTLTKQP